MTQKAAIEEHMRSKAHDHAEREVALREQGLRIREEAAKQALLMLGWPLTQQRATKYDEETGAPVEMIFEPARWTKATIPSFYNLAIGNDPRPEQSRENEDTDDYSNLSTQELRDLLNLASKIGVRRPG